LRFKTTVGARPKSAVYMKITRFAEGSVLWLPGFSRLKAADKGNM
jgi:hypothetical protein